MNYALAPFATAARSTIRYVKCDGDEPEVVDAKLTGRDWDVTDTAAQRLAAEQELGDLASYNRSSVQWFIHPESNSAVLVVYRGPRCSSMPLSSTNS